MNSEEQLKIVDNITIEEAKELIEESVVGILIATDSLSKDVKELLVSADVVVYSNIINLSSKGE